MLPNGYKEFMREKINEFYIQNKKLPNKNDLKEYSVEPLIFEYGNWKYALSELGFQIKESVEDEFNDLLMLQDELEGAPSLIEAQNAGINTKLLINYYNGWKNVKKELKNNTQKTYGIKKTKLENFNEKIKNDEKIIVNITDKYSIIPTVKIAIQEGVEMNRILKKYKTWQNAKKELHLYDIYEKSMIHRIKELNIYDEKSLTKIFNKMQQPYKPDIKPIIKKYQTWHNIYNLLTVSSIQNLSDDEEKIVEKNIEKLKLIKKIIGNFPTENDAKKYDIDVDILLKKYKKWNNIPIK